MKHYVEIVRHFRRVGDETLPPELRTIRAERRPDKLLDWSTVLSSNSSEPVILLAPSGTGKSTELQAQARALRASGRHAVFGEARALVDGFDFGLTHQEKGAFASWKATTDALVLFIDAVDELYLRNRTLRDLLRALDRELNLDTKRIRLVFSARNGSWTAASTQELLRLLRLDSTAKPSLLTFEPLDSRAVRQLAISEGVPNADTFMQAFDEEVAALFELRPTDVALLVSQWRASGRFGNWSQILSDFVAASFGEENPERLRGRLLSPDEGRSGVMRIAGACLLMRQPHVTVPTLSLVPGAISSRRLFDDWPFAKLSEFFENSLFVHKGGEAEAVQLPQGIVSHFLAAQWFAERIRRGLPVETLRNTLMVRVFDEKHYRIPAAHRAAIGWIASEIPPFRRLLLEDHPRIALFEGDAEKVPDAEIRIGLRAHCKQLSESGTERFIAATVVRKLARPTIETEVRALLERYKNSDDVQWHLLQFVEHGGYRSCVPWTLALATNPSATGMVRAAAIDAVGRTGQPDEKRRLLPLLQEQDDDIRLSLLRSLVPDVVHGPELASFLAEGAEHYFRMVLHQVAPKIDVADIEAALQALHPTLTSNVVDGLTNRKFAVAIPLLLELLRRRQPVSDPVIEILAGVEQLIDGPFFLDPDERQGLKDAMHAHDQARKALWLKRFCASRANSRAFAHVLNPAFGEAHPSDLEWLWQLEATETDSRLVVDGVWSRLASVAREQVLDTAPAFFRERHAESLRQEGLANQQRQIRYAANQKGADERRRKNLEVLEPVRAEIEAGDNIRAIEWAWSQIVGGAVDGDGFDLDRLLPLVGQDLLEVFYRGFQACWRKQQVDLPVPGSNRRLVRYDAGLVGLALEARAGLDVSLLSSAEATLAARYALYALNRFPFWFDELLREHQDEVTRILRDAIAQQWWFDGDDSSVLRFAAYSSAETASKLRQIAIGFLELAQPVHLQTLNHALDVVLTSIDELTRLSKLARQGIARCKPASSLLVEWVRLWAHVEPRAAAEWLHGSLAVGDVSTEHFLNLAALLEEDLSGRFGRRVTSGLMSPHALGAWIHLLIANVQGRAIVRQVELHAMGVRDYAQDFRERCLNGIAANPSPEAHAVLTELLSNPAMAAERPLLLHLVERQCMVAADTVGAQWTETDVLDIERGDEKRPRSLEELCSLVLRHLAHVHELVANSDFSYRQLFTKKTKEREIQLWVASCLRERARGLYDVTRESAVDDDKEVDIFAHCAAVGYVPIEIKPLGPPSLKKLESTIEHQLLGQYMLPPDRKFGILLLVRRDRLRWRIGGRERAIEDLVGALRTHASRLGNANGKIIHVECVDLLASPLGKPRKSKPSAPRKYAMAGQRARRRSSA